MLLEHVERHAWINQIAGINRRLNDAAEG
jgi:hypothetical protein